MIAFINTLQVSIREVMEFLKNPEQLTTIIGLLLKTILILFIAKISTKIIDSFVNSFFESQKSIKLKIDPSRMDTIKSLIKSLVKYLIYFIAFASIIKAFGVEIAPLIATAGIGGLAFGFGAQNLVRDVITGFFILFEGQFSVGDYVEVQGIDGVVEEMALRVTKLRGFNGDLHIFPNGEITKVTNKSSGKMRAKVDMSIAYEEDIDHAIKILKEVGQDLKRDNISILEGPTVLGVTELNDTGVTISIIAKTSPMEQWDIERKMRKAFKEAFDQSGIEIPYPRKVIINKAP